uniref:Uncharacterized protein n=1 Tax=Oryza nivara TaxID=4536 RepID=A0A0E0FSQ9_ORYNI
MAPESGRGFAFAGDRRRRRPLREPSALRSAAAARSDRAREARWLTSHHQCWIADPCMKRLPNRGNYVFSDQTLETIGHILVFPGIPAGIPLTGGLREGYLCQIDKAIALLFCT